MIPSFDDATIDQLSRILGEAFTGSDISRILAACNITDTSKESTKWKRLYHTFTERQRQDKCANHVGGFIQAALAPARWSGRRELYGAIRESINNTLILSGFELSANGKLCAVRAAANLDEAEERANRLHAKLKQRSVHPEVLKFCDRLLIRDSNYFHAVFEAAKSLLTRLRTMSGFTTDGNPLIDETLEAGKRPFPIIALNRYDSPSLVNEQKGIAHLARGLVHAFRNVTGHAPQITWSIPEQDALDMMTIASLIHRRLDTATVTTAFQAIEVVTADEQITKTSKKP